MDEFKEAIIEPKKYTELPQQKIYIARMKLFYSVTINKFDLVKVISEISVLKRNITNICMQILL